MKNLIVLFVTCFCFGLHSLTGQNLLVLDNDPQAAPEHYNTYAAAEAAAQNGDILYVKSSGTGYGTIVVTKSLTLIGQGVQLNSSIKDISGVDGVESRFDSIIVDADDVGLFGIYLKSRLILNGDNVIVKGCYASSTTTIGINTSVVLLQNNIFKSTLDLAATGINNVNISNNIISGKITGGGSAQNQFIIAHNHVLYSSGSWFLDNVRNSLIQSNVFINGLHTVSVNASNAYKNNISPDGTLGTANGNQSNVLMTTVFDAVPGSYDRNFYLKTSSPALNAAHDGTNVGITGGTVPAINVGNAPVPLITELTVEAIDQDNNLNIQIKAEAKQ